MWPLPVTCKAPEPLIELVIAYVPLRSIVSNELSTTLPVPKVDKVSFVPTWSVPALMVNGPLKLLLAANISVPVPSFVNPSAFDPLLPIVPLYDRLPPVALVVSIPSIELFPCHRSPLPSNAMQQAADRAAAACGIYELTRATGTDRQCCATANAHGSNRRHCLRYHFVQLAAAADRRAACVTIGAGKDSATAIQGECSAQRLNRLCCPESVMVFVPWY